MKGFKKIPVETTFLEMTDFKEKKVEEIPEINDNVFILEVKNSNVDFYKFLYKQVGGAWGWSQRLLISKEELHKVISSAKVKLFVLYIDGMPSGFAEFEQKNETDTELKYFGVIPQLVGKGYGKKLFNWTLNKVKQNNIKRLLLNTCVLDSENALPFYIKSGFKVVKKEVLHEYYPVDFLKNKKIVSPV